jgi:hypothetical protein
MEFNIYMILLLVATHGPQADCDTKLAESGRWIYFAYAKLEVRLVTEDSNLIPAFVKFKL